MSYSARSTRRHRGRMEGRAAQARHICSREAGAPSLGCGPHGDADESRASERRAPQRDAGMLAGSRVSFRDAVHAYNLLDAYTYGFALQEKTIRSRRPSSRPRWRRSPWATGGVSTPTLRRSLSSSRPRLARATPKSSRSVSPSSSMGSNDSRENDPFRKVITADELVDGSRHA
jgi:hypothetical protein